MASVSSGVCLDEIVGRDLAACSYRDGAQMPAWETVALFPTVHSDGIDAEQCREVLAVSLRLFEIGSELHGEFSTILARNAQGHCCVIGSMPRKPAAKPAIYNRFMLVIPANMNRIKQLREARGLTLEQVAEAMGTTTATVSRLENGRRKLTDQWIYRIGDVLEATPIDILGGEQRAAAQTGLPVRGDVAAGIWREADIQDEPKYSAVPIGPDERYPPERQYALAVQGTSMNKRFPPGSFIVCVPWDTIERDPRDGDIVVVERRRDGMVESTVKKVVAKGRSVKLSPESDDPRWQESYKLEPENDGDQVAIRALVVGKYEQL
jgi:transcriptional regulator with XRE-family HTH domain